MSIYRPPLAVAALVLVLAAALGGCRGDSEDKLLESAQAFMSKKEYKSATIQLKTLLQRNANSPQARYLLGRALLETGDPAGALLELRKARDLAHPDDQVVPEMARAMLLTGEHARVISQFGATVLGTPAAQADLYTSVAIAHAASAQFDKAKESLARALRANAQFAPALILQARLKAGENDLDGALKVLDDVLGREANNERAGTLRGELLWRGKRDEAGALAALRKVIASTPAAVAAHVALIGIHAELGRAAEAKAQFLELKKAAPNHPDTLYIEGQVALQEGNAQAARDIATRMLKAMPNHPRVQLLAGAADFRLRSYNQAETYLTRALRAMPYHNGARQLLAQTYLRMQQPAKALEVLGPAIEQKSVDGATLALAGEAHMLLGDTKRADQWFQLAAKASPTDPRVRTALALAQYARGETQPAIDALESIAASDAGGSRADLALISARLRAADFAGALKAVDALQKKMPERALPELLRGRVLLAKKDTAGATAAFETALRKDPKFVLAASALASLDLAAGRNDAARKRIQDVVAADPNNVQARMALAEVTARTGGTGTEVAQIFAAAVKANPAQPEPRLLYVEHLLRMGDAQAALIVAQDGIAALPGHNDLMSALGRAQLAAGDARQAVGTFGQLATKNPAEAIHQLRLAEAHVQNKDLGAARAALRKALEIEPESLAAKRGLAALALQQERPDEARVIAREIQKSRPKEASGYQLEGDVERQQRNWPAAVAAYRKAFAIARGTDLAIRLHQSLFAGGQRADADRLVADWQKENPKDFGFSYYLGDLAMSRADFASGEKHYRAVLDVQPRNALALNNVAWLMAKQGKTGAVPLAEQANQILPNRPQLMDTLATALAAEGEVKRAVDVQKRAVQIDRHDPNLRLNLARLYLKAGEKPQARAELEDLARLGERFRAQAEVTDLLRLAR
ncbi:MAG: PEP-CTERM system TPR-repeat protein PrsT [Burkholderiales bacterium]|nr:PEP-CTERM system TPR-repeat protein PrsT [Burkholderiales bacterium]